ncbi:hypothetical protein, partial [Burkholderia ubonensis]|uniref:hypothetical protein n=1 Tax=Burkholderia ubonensis TaxID=101571 RepID=UPI001E58EC39
EHLCFPSFGSSLYTTCWKAKFQGKLTLGIVYKSMFNPHLQRACAEPRVAYGKCPLWRATRSPLYWLISAET